jgi:hypothetical protein
MKIIITLMLMFSGVVSFAQSSEEHEVKRVIKEFFNAFHEQDSVALRELSLPGAILNSVSINDKKEGKFSSQAYSAFIKGIVGIPETTKFEEKIHSYNTIINLPIATVITPYSFYINDELSHCGVNTFQLIKLDGKWKISYIIDTRKKEGCEKTE